MAQSECSYAQDDPGDASQAAAASRRAFMVTTLGLIAAGCASQQATTSLPSPEWDLHRTPRMPDVAEPSTASNGLPSYVIARSKWAESEPAPSLMDRMLPVKWITVHHDGMSAFTASDQQSAAARLEAIRKAHRAKGWGDIGYHFAVDRGGRVWQGRPLRWQGAHVKDCNPGNIGVVMLGNFDVQSPSKAQLDSLNMHLTWLMRTYNVPVTRLRTHQEWPTARTACPGRSLQSHMLSVRRGGMLA